MVLETRFKKRIPVEAVAEYAIHESTEKGIKLNIPSDALESETARATFIKSSLIDISILGCAIDSAYLIPPGVILDIKIDPALFNTEAGISRKEPIRALGRVTSCVMRSQGHYRLGVCFTKIDKEALEVIGNFINLKERRKAPRWDMSK